MLKVFYSHVGDSQSTGPVRESSGLCIAFYDLGKLHSITFARAIGWDSSKWGNRDSCLSVEECQSHSKSTWDRAIIKNTIPHTCIRIPFYLNIRFLYWNVYSSLANHQFSFTGKWSSLVSMCLVCGLQKICANCKQRDSWRKLCIFN